MIYLSIEMIYQFDLNRNKYLQRIVYQIIWNDNYKWIWKNKNEKGYETNKFIKEIN